MQPTPDSPPPAQGSSKRKTIAVVLVLIAAFAALATTAAVTKSPTVDEPLHVASAYVLRFLGDHRIDSQDPALFQWLASLPMRRGDAAISPSDPAFVTALRESPYTWRVAVDGLFQGGTDGDAAIRRSRFVFIALGMGLIGLLAWWTWNMGGDCHGMGALGCVLAAGMAAFDPNLIAHTAIVKNDVPAALAILGGVVATHRVGKRATAWSIALLGIVCGLAVCVKYSALVIAVIVPILLLCRALLYPPAWSVFSRRLEHARARILGAAVILLVVAIVAWAVLWTCYGWRYNATVDPAAKLDTDSLVLMDTYQRAFNRGLPTPKSVAEAEANAATMISLARFAERHHLLPQPWIHGFLFVSAWGQRRQTFLMGEFSETGWWYYFPLAMTFKTPTAIIVLALVLVAAVVLRVRFRRPAVAGEDEDSRRFAFRWNAACLIAPVALFGAFSLTSNLNLGIRHVLPIYPFLYCAMGLGAARLIQQGHVRGRALAFGLAAMLLAETLLAAPNFLAFFNWPAGGTRGGLRLLSDSNLDWGQDLKLLAKWQKDNPNEKLFLRYFGTADPAFYGIRYTNLPGGYVYGPVPRTPDTPGSVIAISATYLQGLYEAPELHAMYERYWRMEPFAVLGGSIYLYRYEP